MLDRHEGRTDTEDDGRSEEGTRRDPSMRV